MAKISSFSTAIMFLISAIKAQVPTLVANNKKCAATNGAFALNLSEPGKIVYDLDECNVDCNANINCYWFDLKEETVRGAL